MIYAYIRVSTEKQTVENQRFEINEFLKKENLKVDCWIEETVSGRTDFSKRELGRFLQMIKKDDLIVTTEISRLGRSLFMIMEILQIAMKNECKIWTIKDNFRLGNDIQSKVLAFAFGISAEIERNLISQRTKEALARRRAEGTILGRRTGSKNSKHILDEHTDEIIKMLEAGYSQKRIAEILNVHRNTIWKWIKAQK